MRHSQIAILFALAVCGCNDTSRPPLYDSSSNPNSTEVKPADRDNTAINQRDRDGATKTPIDQNENQQDINVTADIRKRIVGEEFSTNAKNVKIITQNGKVTLRGPVASAEEKKRIEVIARAVAGDSNVDSQLEVEKNP